MGKGRPRTPHVVVDARKAVVDALMAGEPLTEAEARELVNRLTEKARSAGWSAGYYDGYTDADNNS
jgi:hypothetical protein